MTEQESSHGNGVTAAQIQSLGNEQELSSDPLPMEVTRRLYVIESAGVHFALDDAFSCGEVLSEPRIYPLPGCAHSLLGVCYRRGDIVPIYDLALLLGVEETENDSAKQWSALKSHHNVHYLPVNRKTHKTYVVVMGGKDDVLVSSTAEGGSDNYRPSGSIGFALSAPPKSLILTEDDINNAKPGEHCIAGLMPKFITTTTCYAKIDRPVIHLDWLGYCVTQVKALADH